VFRHHHITASENLYRSRMAPKSFTNTLRAPIVRSSGIRR
jgi:hypothetical protein